MSDIVERLKYGLIEHRKRWSGDTHTDLGGSVDYEASGKLMDEAAAEIARLRAKVAKADALADALKFYATATVEYPNGKVTFQPGDDNGQRAQEALAAYRETDT